MPRSARLDETVALLREGYRFLPERRRRLGADVFRTRLMGEEVICTGGPDAARLLYDGTRFERRTAMPSRIQRTLVGEAGVQTLDDAEHEHRKAMFMALMSPASIGALVAQTGDRWETALEHWSRLSRVVLFDELPPVLFDSACAWAGVPLDGIDRIAAARDMMAMVDAFGAAGPRHWRGRRARRRSEAWVVGRVVDCREGRIDAPEGSALDVVAHHHDRSGRRLDEQVAAVELLNLLRPIVAITWYVTFAAHALHQHPAWRERVASGSDDRERFVQEVRRFYPFAPFVGTRTRRRFEWEGYTFPEGRLVLLDVYGAGRDPALWERPDVFAPERFAARPPGMFDLIPQGGGDQDTGHRCAGEQITVEQMKLAVGHLAGSITYDVPRQNLDVPLGRIPTHPRDGFAMDDVTRLS